MSQPDLYNLEYRAREDDAWCSVSVEVSNDGQTLKIVADCAEDNWKPRFRARDFKTAAEVDEFLSRFRPVSQPLQDSECRRVTAGMTVCASLSTPGKDDLLFYDAVVDAVRHVDHLNTNGEEECVCTFLLCWQHGPSKGYMSLGGVADICLINTQPASIINSNIEIFGMFIKESIVAANPKSSQEHVNPKDNHLDSNLNEFNTIPSNNDTRVGADILGSDPGYYVLIDNLDQNPSALAISQLLHQYTDVSPRVHLYPIRSAVPFGSAAIATTSREDIDKIYEFLVNPDQLIVSSEGRPWVVYEKVFDGSCDAPGLIPQAQDEHVRQEKQEFQVVHSGSEEYDVASHVRDMVLKFQHFQERMYAKLSLQQEEKLKSFPSRKTKTTR